MLCFLMLSAAVQCITKNILDLVSFAEGLNQNFLIDLVTVFDAILTSRQMCEKLQCLYENPMSNNFHKTAVLKKNINCKLKLKAKDCPKQFWGRTCA